MAGGPLAHPTRSSSASRSSHPREQPRPQRKVAHLHVLVRVVTAVSVAHENHRRRDSLVYEILRVVSCTAGYVYHAHAEGSCTFVQLRAKARIHSGWFLKRERAQLERH